MILLTVDEIAHYGVKGMKWGVRKEYIPHPRKPGKNQETAQMRQFLKSRGGDVAKSIYKDKSKAWIASRIAAAPITALAVAKVSPKLINDVYREKRATNLKAGTQFQRITSTPDEKLQRIYATYNEHDNRMYRGRLGYLRMRQNSGDTYVKTFTAKSGVKAPSDDKARSMFQSLYDGDQDFKKYVDRMPKLVRGYVENAKTTKDRYKNFNLQGLMDRDPENAKQVQKYYDLLAKNGYNAITDLNDRYYSTFKANNPLIIFDMQNLVETNVRKLSSQEVKSDLAYDAKVRIGRAAANKWLGITTSDDNTKYFYDEKTMAHSEDLYHYGIKGMRWGVRKKRDLNPRTSAKKDFNKIRRQRKRDLYKDMASLNDVELRNRINRMQMENQYRLLNQSGTRKIGKRFVEAAFVGAAVGVVSARSQKIMNQGVDKGAEYVVKLLARMRG